MARALQARQGRRHSGHHLGLRPAAGGQGHCAPPMSAPRTTTSASTSPRSRMELKPKGGTICIQSGGAAAANHNERMQGIRDTLAGKSRHGAAGRRADRPERLDGSRRLPALSPTTTAPSPCSRFGDILGKYPDLDAFIADRRASPQWSANAYPPGRRPEHGRASKAGRARLRVGRHAAACRWQLLKDGLQPRPGRPAAVRDGLARDAATARHQGRQDARPTRSTRASTSAPPPTPSNCLAK